MSALFAMSACASTARRLPALAPGVSGELHVPDMPGRHAAVVILHGRGGLKSVYHDEAEILAKRGFVALVLDYYAVARANGWSRSRREWQWREWERMVLRAMEALRARDDVDPDRIALIGFSQGGALALTVTARVPRVAAVVDYFGPDPESWIVAGFMGFVPPEDHPLWANMPPTLLLHGQWDPIVPVAHARRIQRDLLAHRREVSLHVYPRTLHGFNDADSGLSNDPTIANDARSRVLTFLDRHLAGETTPSGL